MKTMMMKSGLLLLAILVTFSEADIVFENELIKTAEIFDLDYARDSNVWAYENGGLNQSKYYCVFRNNWSSENHPVEYPELARWGSPLMFTHTKQHIPYIKGRRAPHGVEQVAEHGFQEVFESELIVAGSIVYNWTSTKGFFINQQRWDENFVYMPPVKVSPDFPFLSGLAGMSPSPDWFSHFYLFEVIKEQGQTYWDGFKIRTYPWDAGTDDGDHYTSPDRDTESLEGFVTRIDVGNTVNDIYLSPSKDQVRHTAEWECVLHTCPAEDPECQKPNWPPANGCDILRYPLCANTCNPEADEKCEQCRRKTSTDEEVFHEDCCLAGYLPKKGGQTECDKRAGLAKGVGSSSQMTTMGMAVVLAVLALL